MMKGISLWQPWAWLMQFSAKRIETRPWPWPRKSLHRPTLICSTATTPRDAMSILSLAWFQDAIRQTDVSADRPYEQVASTDPQIRHGHALAVGWPIVSLQVGVSTAPWNVMVPDGRQGDLSCAGAQSLPPKLPERAFGDYAPGRYATLFAGLRPIPRPFPVKGGQRVWNVQPTDEARVIEQLGPLNFVPEPWKER